MSDDLVKRLRGPSGVKDWQTAIHIHATDARAAADRIEALIAALEKADALAVQLDGTHIWMERVHAAASSYRAAREATT